MFYHKKNANIKSSNKLYCLIKKNIYYTTFAAYLKTLLFQLKIILFLFNEEGNKVKENGIN